MKLLEKNLLPDPLIRWGIRRLLRKRLREEAVPGRRSDFVEALKAGPIALHTADANLQHYELPTDFFRRVLGPHMKYSSGFWPNGATDLAESERVMLELTCRRARIEDGQRVLELGCGWGSLTLYIASQYPRCRVTGVSNSRTQKEYIDSEAARRGLANVTILTADMNDFEAPGTFDRIVSVEMFEHLRNYDAFLARVASWMKPDALLFVHIFCHARFAYPFEMTGDDDWMARYFFTGGIMPSADLLPRFNRNVRLMEQWIVEGIHYERTCNAWLAQMDRQRGDLMPILASTYGKENALKWWVYWRVFFMSCAELFGFQSGREWFVAHYLFAKNG